MARLLRHRQTKGAATDRPILPPPRHIPTLPTTDSRVLPLGDNLPMLCADKLKLKQILINLLSNAIKFTDTGGKRGPARRRRARSLGHGLINWCCEWRCPVLACLCPVHPRYCCKTPSTEILRNIDSSPPPSRQERVVASVVSILLLRFNACQIVLQQYLPNRRHSIADSPIFEIF